MVPPVISHQICQKPLFNNSAKYVCNASVLFPLKMMENKFPATIFIIGSKFQIKYGNSKVLLRFISFLKYSSLQN